MCATYAVFFNGVFYSRHKSKGAALDAAYRHVNTAQYHNYRAGEAGSEDCRKAADDLSRPMFVMAGTLPAASRERCVKRHVYTAHSGPVSIGVRRDDCPR